MEFLFRPGGKPKRLGILPGSFNPPTKAHLALAEAALVEVDEVALVLPRTFPHKDYHGATFTQRAAMLCASIERHPRLRAATSDGGMFTDIACECHAAYGPGISLSFICGRDAAERVVSWDYGDPNAIARMLVEFSLLVASRQGDFQPPPRLAHRIRKLPMTADVDGISASEVRRRIASGERWEHLVPDAIVPMVREIYRPPAYSS